MGGGDVYSELTRFFVSAKVEGVRRRALSNCR